MRVDRTYGYRMDCSTLDRTLASSRQAARCELSPVHGNIECYQQMSIENVEYRQTKFLPAMCRMAGCRCIRAADTGIELAERAYGDRHNSHAGTVLHGVEGQNPQLRCINAKTQS